MATTATAPPTTGSPDERMCVKCKTPMAKVEGVDVWNCNTCGRTEGDVTSDVKPDEVLDPKAEQVEEEMRRDPLAELEAAEHRAVSMPGVPGRDEFLTLAQTARMLSMSPLVPKAMRGQPLVAFHIAMMGRDLGISPTAAAQLIDVIPEDKDRPEDGGQASLSPALINAQCRRLGLGKVVPLLRERDKAIAVALAPDGYLDFRCTSLGRHWEGPAGERCDCHGILGQSQFTWADGIDAGLIDPRCTPGNGGHFTDPTHQNWKLRKCNCRQGYRTYPQRMMWWRAAGWAGADFFPEAGLGLYSAEELGAAVDDQGRMIDPRTVDLPDGFQPAALEPAPGELLVDPVLIAWLFQRIRALPADVQVVLAERMNEKRNEGRLDKLAELQERHLQMAEALINGAEAEAKKAGWTKPDLPRPDLSAPASAPPAAQDAPESAESTGVAPAPPEGTQGESEPSGEVRDTAGFVLNEHLAEQHGKREPVLTERLVDQAIAAVKILTPRALNAALRKREMSVDGDERQRRQQLGRALAKEAAEQEWHEANGTQPTLDTPAPDLSEAQDEGE